MDFTLSFPWKHNEISTVLPELRAQVTSVASATAPQISEVLLEQPPIDPDAPELIREAITCLELNGLLEGFGGQGLQGIRKVVKPRIDYQAEWDLLNKLHTGGLSRRGAIEFSQPHPVFLEAFRRYCDIDQKDYPFVRSLAISWNIYAVDGDKDESHIERLCDLLNTLWSTGRAARLDGCVFAARMHRIPIEEVLQLEGWLRGRTAQLLNHPPDSIEYESGKILRPCIRPLVKTCMGRRGIDFAQKVIGVAQEILCPA